MNGPGGWDDDMPNFPSSPAGGVPAIGDPAFEMLLAGDLPPADAEWGLRPLAEAIAALTVPPSACEIAGEADARAAYRGGFTRPARARRAGTRPARGAGARNSGHGRIRLLASVLSVKLVTAGAVAAAVAAGGLTAAAYAGVLPAPVQSFAHHALGAPAPHLARPPRQPVTSYGPAPAIPGAYGLCQAYAQARANGNGREKAVAFRNLAAASGGAARVKAYCAAAAHPGKTPPGHQGGHHGGKPSASSSHAPASTGASKSAAHPSHPSHAPGSHPNHPSHQRVSHPSHGRASHPTGRPASHPQAMGQVDQAPADASADGAPSRARASNGSGRAAVLRTGRPLPRAGPATLAGPVQNPAPVPGSGAPGDSPVAGYREGRYACLGC
jgi:hypothetical protein